MSFVEYHKPCPLCGSSDAASVNEDGSAYCFSCYERIPDYYGDNKFEDNVEDFRTYKNNSMNNNDGDFIALTDRCISLDTARKFGVKATKYQDNVTSHLYPYYIANEIVGTKVRDCKTKDFSWRGSPKGTMLFGQQLWQHGGKFITIVEGECDAMSAYELMGSKWPVVSVKNGAGGAVKDLKENLEFLESFDNVVINFDNDKVGMEAATKAARLFKPGKAKIVHLPPESKDANDMLRNNKKSAYMAAWWAAKVYTPAGVLDITDMKEEFFSEDEKESIPYPWEGLNEKLFGIRMGELVTVTAGTGTGKSSVVRELEHWLLKTTKDNVGILALEENWKRTVYGLLSIEADKRLYIKQIRDEVPKEQLSKYFDFLHAGDNAHRLIVHSHLGVQDVDELFSKLRYMIIGLDCKWVVIDHLGMMTSAMAEGDERRAIDNIMTRLRSLVEETGVGMVLVSHLRRIDGNKGHENGIEVAMSHLRGSNGIGQISDCVIALERNQQSDDPVESATTRLRVLKSRYTGETGLAGHLLYDKDTGRLSETFVEEDKEEIEL
jgi:twinkle protein